MPPPPPSPRWKKFYSIWLDSSLSKKISGHATATDSGRVSVTEVEICRRFATGSLELNVCISLFSSILLPRSLQGCFERIQWCVFFGSGHNKRADPAKMKTNVREKKPFFFQNLGSSDFFLSWTLVKNQKLLQTQQNAFHCIRLPSHRIWTRSVEQFDGDRQFILMTRYVRRWIRNKKNNNRTDEYKENGN